MSLGVFAGVCVCVYVGVCMYVCMYVCIHACMWNVCTYIYACMHACIGGWMYSYVHWSIRVICMAMLKQEGYAQLTLTITEIIKKTITIFRAIIYILPFKESITVLRTKSMTVKR